MGSWRVLVAGWGVILAICLAVGSETSLPAVVPPLAAAALVLFAAAIASDYFGLVRRATPWRGQVVVSPHSRARTTVLEQRFTRDRAAGSVRTASSARALLVALAETNAWARAADVVDFLNADAEQIAGAAARAWTEPGVRRDLMLLRASALARTGQGDRARGVLGDLVGAGFRREVEALLEVSDARIGLAAQEALGLRSTYRSAS
jgi:hypothetical protein